MAPGTELSRSEHLAADAAVHLGENLEMDDAVVDEDDVPDIDVVDEAVVVDVHRVELLAADAAHGELHDVADLQVELHGKVAGADGGPLGVHQDADGEGELVGDFTDGGDDLADPVVVGVAHVEQVDVRAGQHHLAETLGCFGRGVKLECFVFPDDLFFLFRHKFDAAVVQYAIQNASLDESALGLERSQPEGCLKNLFPAERGQINFNSKLLGYLFHFLV